MRYSLCFIISTLVSLNFNVAFAESNLFCAFGSQYIKVGMSIMEVQSACGKPISESKSEEAEAKRIPVTQWFYSFGSNELGQGNESLSVGRSTTGKLIVTFQNGKVTSTQFEGASAPSTSVCKNGSIEQGNSFSDVSYACGDPNYTNETYTDKRTNKQAEVIRWSIKPTEYAAPVQLTFINGVLKSIGN